MLSKLGGIFAFMFVAGPAFAFHGPISGSYQFQTSGCYIIPSNAKLPLEADLSESDSQIDINVAVDLFGQKALSPLNSLYIGDSTMPYDGGEYRIVGTYLNCGFGFDYKEFDNEAHGLPMRELRSTNLTVSDDLQTLTITTAEAGHPARTCVLKRLK